MLKLAQAHQILEGSPEIVHVILEAVKVDSLQKLCSSMEPILRRIVSEEVERALAKFAPAKLNGRTSPKRIEGLNGRNLQLQFKSRMSLSLFTGGKVEGERGSVIRAVLLDMNSGHVVTSGPESSAKLDVVVLEGDFNNEDDENWTEQDFESHVVKEREGKRPLLAGELQVTLKEGVGTLGELTFTDNSSWIRSRKFRLGLKVTAGFCEGTRIREAKTDAFTVKDHRGELYKKHYPPALNDDVWRLEKIGKDGSFHKRLNKAGIHTVEDFLRLVVRDSQRLRSVLGNGMSNKMWEGLIEHAKTCVTSPKIYVYYADDTKHVGVIFNNIYELIGLFAGEQYYSAESLSDNQKDYVDTLVKKAYENWTHIVDYEGKGGFLSFKPQQSRSASSSQSAPDYEQHTLLPVVPLQHQHSVESALTVGGGSGVNYDHHLSHHPQSSYIQFGGYNSQNQSIVAPPHESRSDKIGLALGPPQQAVFQTGVAGPSMYQDDWSGHHHQRDNSNRVGVDDSSRVAVEEDDFFSEEDLRMRSHEILENEDMQDLLRSFSMGVNTPLINAPHESGEYAAFSPFMPTNFRYEDEVRSTSSGPAAKIGWLKLKAALRWGIFVRKQAAQRRAHLVELDD
ncbi:hypothetical protein ACHQM5_030689 [Ranunculus cassubicifolius]